MKRPKVLVLGYGNPGRLDDGLGPACAGAIEQLAIEGVVADANYQLTVEDAAAVAEYDWVLFVDASIDAPEPFAISRVVPQPALSFSSHSVQPAAVMALAEELFDARTIGLLVCIRGYEFDAFGEELSERAQANLEATLRFLEPALRQGTPALIEQAKHNAAPTGAQHEDEPCATEST